MALREVADRLYAVPPAEFTAMRGREAEAARAAGDRALAAEVGRLRRPSVGAWLVNQLARQLPGELDDLLELGARLRAAQDALDGDQLRQLSGQRRRAIDGLTAQAARLAQQSGARLSDAAAREVAATLDAAVADAAAADAVRSGVLVRALRSSGFDAVDLDGALALPDAGAAGGRPALRAVPGAGPARRSSSRALDTARDAAAVAQRRLVKADTAMAAAAAELDRCRQGVSAAADDLERAQEAFAAAERRRSDAEHKHALAEQECAEASAARDRARQALAEAERADGG